MDRKIYQTTKTRIPSVQNRDSLSGQGNRAGFIPQQGPQENSDKKTAHYYLQLSLIYLALTLPITCISTLLFSVTAFAEQVFLDLEHFDHIQFKRIKPNTVSFNNGGIIFQVNRSASFLLHAFDNIKPVHNVSFQWRADGRLKKLNAEHEASRKGDDAWIRVGLILKGEPQLFLDPFIPHWVKQVRKTLKFPSDKMVYLIPDAKHATGQTWTSPFSNNVDSISVESSRQQDGWYDVNYNFKTLQKVIGVWLMADGDNTQSAFTSEIKNLVIK